MESEFVLSLEDISRERISQGIEGLFHGFNFPMIDTKRLIMKKIMKL